MGYMRHHAICVTSLNERLIAKAHAKAKLYLPRLVTEIVGPVVNGYYSFFVAPDGSKEGWPESDEAEAGRTDFTKWLDEQCFSDGSNSLQWVLVQYGDDRYETKVVADSDYRWRVANTKEFTLGEEVQEEIGDE